MCVHEQLRAPISPSVGGSRFCVLTLAISVFDDAEHGGAIPVAWGSRKPKISSAELIHCIWTCKVIVCSTKHMVALHSTGVTAAAAQCSRILSY